MEQSNGVEIVLVIVGDQFTTLSRFLVYHLKQTQVTLAILKIIRHVHT